MNQIQVPMKKQAKGQIKFSIIVLITILFTVKCNAEDFDYEKSYLGGEYIEIYKTTSKDDLFELQSADLHTFLAARYKRYSIDTSGMYHNRFNDIFIENIMFEEDFCDSLTFNQENLYILPLDSFWFNEYRAIDIFSFAMTYEFYHKCNIQVKDKFLRESLLRDSTNFVVIFEMGKTALAGGKYNEALFLFEYVLSNYGHTDYLEKCKNYVLQQGGNSDNIHSLEVLLKTPIATELVDSLYYTEYF
jgi:hypothetical protein